MAMIKKSLVFIFLGMCGILTAREVTIAEAQCVAVAWAERNGVFAGVSSQVQRPIAVTDAEGATLYYKVMLGERGMVIVSGDTSLPPVIAALPESTSPDIPDGHPLKAFLSQDIAQRRAMFVTASSSRRALLSADATEVITRNNSRWEELLGTTENIQTFALNTTGAPARVYSYPKPWSTRQITHWNQTSENEYIKKSASVEVIAVASDDEKVSEEDTEKDEGKEEETPEDEEEVTENLEHTIYNMYLPGINGPSMYAGCVAIAGASILEFFQVPSGPSEVVCTYQLNGVENEITTIGGVYDWSLLPTWTQGVALSYEARNLLATVAFDVGVLVGTNYKNESSSATPSELAVALRRFGFTNASYTTVTDVTTRVYPQVRAGAPVYLAISDSTDNGGHAVVAVGYGEDDGGAPYTRLFMGWGGLHDAWYALPTIQQSGAFSYNALVGFITAISRDQNVLALCGRVTNDSGEGVPYEPVTITFTPRDVVTSEGQEEIEEPKEQTHTITTGLHGEYAARLPFSTCYNIMVGGQTKTIQNLEYPGPIDFTIDRADVLQVYTEAQTALDVARQTGKMLFVLSGTAWDEACTDIKKVLAALGESFNKDFVFFYSDNDYGSQMMNVGAPGYATYDPRKFVLAQGAVGNAVLAKGTGCNEEDILQVLTVSRERWKGSGIKSVEIVGETAAMRRGFYSLRVTYGDGLVLTPPDVEWSVFPEGAAIDSHGELTLTETEATSVTVAATVTLDGTQYTEMLEVRNVAPEEIVDVDIGGVEGDVIYLEETPRPIFICTAMLSDGTTCRLFPEWTVSEPADWFFPSIDDTTGVLSYASHPTYEGETHTITVSATYNDGATITREYTIYGYVWAWVEDWEIVPREVFPGTIVRMQVNTIAYIEAGKKYSTSDPTFAVYQLFEQIGSTDFTYVTPFHAIETMEIAIPREVSSGAKTFYLDARKRGGCYATYTRGACAQMGVRPLTMTTVAGPERGEMPYGWLQQQFMDETITDLEAKADEDSDGDGYTNWQEYILGTDPNDKSSTLQVDILVSTDNTPPKVTWNERPGRTYELLGADSLVGDWKEVRDSSRFFKVSVKAK